VCRVERFDRTCKPRKVGAAAYQPKVVEVGVLTTPAGVNPARTKFSTEGRVRRDISPPVSRPDRADPAC
jgi:hypothetical protein